MSRIYLTVLLVVVLHGMIFAQENIVLENKTLHLEFSKDNGALVKMSAVQSGWKILDRPELGLSFRLLVPIDKRRDNPVFGEKQKPTSIIVSDDHKSIKLIYDSVNSEHGGKLDIKVVLTVTLTERQAEFGGQIENRSPYIIENVYWPYLGDVQHPEKAKWLKTFAPGYGSAWQFDIWPSFPNHRGYFGVDYPEQFSQCNPVSPFFLIRSENEGLYAGIHSYSYEVITYNTEYRPGVVDSMDNRVPQEPNISGKECSLRFAVVHLPFIGPKESQAIVPIVFEAFQGDWTAGADIYKNWRNTWMKLPAEPNWAKEPHSWLQVHINSPEDELRMPYKDIWKIGEDCVKHGVKAIQLVGWNLGVQDRGNPSHSTDPRLGTPEELAASIKKIQAMGVKVILFSKFTWADQSTDWFAKDLIKQAVKDPYGNYYVYGGYQYQTVTQLLDINTRRLIPMCFLSQNYLNTCDAEFKKVLSLGPDGILFDECAHHAPAWVCFDTRHGHSYGAPVYANDCKLIENFNTLLRQARKTDFLFAGEGLYDWEFEAYNVSYFRSNSKAHAPVSRYLLPYSSLMTGVWGFNDRNMINQCLMYRYIISYEPYNFKGKMDDFTLTAAYGQKMDALRTELRDYFWDGEFRYEKGAKVTLAGMPYHPYSVFINHKNNKLGVIIVNYDDKPITPQIEIEGAKNLRYRLVDSPVWNPVDKGITIPPNSAAAVIE